MEGVTEGERVNSDPLTAVESQSLAGVLQAESVSGTESLRCGEGEGLGLGGAWSLDEPEPGRHLCCCCLS